MRSSHAEEHVQLSVSGTVVTVLGPTMTNEVLVSWSRLTLDNTWRDPSKVSLSAYPELAGYNQGFFPNQSLSFAKT